MVPLKELQEAGLGPGGPLDAPESYIITGSLQVPHVHGQVLQPQTSTLPDCGQLGRSVEEMSHRHSHLEKQGLRDVQQRCVHVIGGVAVLPLTGSV